MSEAYRNLKEVFTEEDKHHIEVWLKLLRAETGEPIDDLAD